MLIIIRAMHKCQNTSITLSDENNIKTSLLSKFPERYQFENYSQLPAATVVKSGALPDAQLLVIEIRIGERQQDDEHHKRHHDAQRQAGGAEEGALAQAPAAFLAVFVQAQCCGCSHGRAPDEHHARVDQVHLEIAIVAAAVFCLQQVDRIRKKKFIEKNRVGYILLKQRCFIHRVSTNFSKTQTLGVGTKTLWS